MGLKIGIVGLPNVGKSTLFNALVKGSHAESANYPFCTIEPNVGIVEVPDERLKPLAEISKSKKIVPAVVEFVDIAGLVRGASKGEGLGNQFLANIRECDAIGMVVRFFEDENVTHVEGKLSPLDDISTIETELQLADINTVEKRLFSVEKELKTGSKESRLIHSGLQKIKDKLYAGQNAREATLDELETKALKGLGLMTQKPIIYIANVSENQLSDSSWKEVIPAAKRDNFVPICAKLEAELNELEDTEKAEYLETLGIDDTGLNTLIKKAYTTLGLATYLTSGETETRAWTFPIGATAPEAAGVIHGDFEKGFIAAEIVPWQDFFAQGGWNGAKSHGLVRTEGKNYIMKDGDLVVFRFNV